MQINITSRGQALSEHLQHYVEEKVGKLEKYVQGNGEVHVVLERGTTGQVVEITFHGLHKTMHAREIGDNMQACVDKAVTKIETQVRKHKDKLTDKRS